MFPIRLWFRVGAAAFRSLRSRDVCRRIGMTGRGGETRNTPSQGRQPRQLDEVIPRRGLR